MTNNRRMFSNRIINSARFLQMPEGAQNLYFHLGMRADDDGIVEAYPIIKMLGSAPDNLKVLIAKSFVRQLNNEQVVFITDWLEHNSIRADRKTDSIHKDLLLQSFPSVKLLKPKPRADTKKITGRTMDGQWTDNGQPKLSKVKLSKEKKIGAKAPIPSLIDFFYEQTKEVVGIKPEISGKKDSGLLKLRLIKYTPEQIKSLIAWYIHSKDAERLGYNISHCLSSVVINKWKYEEGIKT